MQLEINMTFIICDEHNVRILEDFLSDLIVVSSEEILRVNISWIFSSVGEDGCEHIRLSNTDDSKNVNELLREYPDQMFPCLYPFNFLYPPILPAEPRRVSRLELNFPF